MARRQPLPEPQICETTGQDNQPDHREGEVQSVAVHRAGTAIRWPY
jgi:hypothetical protein